MTLNGTTRLAAAWLIATSLCGWFEFQRLQAAMDSPGGLLSWFTNWDPETTLPLLVLLALPLLRLVSHPGSQRGTVAPQQVASVRQRLAAGCLVFCVSMLASAAVGLQHIDVPNGLKKEPVRFCLLPPAYHDEYSYLLQARTFASGRLSWPAVPTHPDLFHQVHVLNERATASRYFPWTGLWIAPFLQTGLPVVGHWLAGALAAAFFYLTAAEVLRPRPALTAGLMIACSPGLAIFSNLLLAHHPTLLALSVFLWTMVRLLRYPSVLLTLLSGTALSLAMLGRPMTAAGFALPWGVLFLIRILRNSDSTWAAQRFRLLLAMGAPIVGGFVVLGILNQSITGSFTRSAYQEYTDVYTPRHAYGFNNGVRGDAMQSPKVLRSYDQWAENLTWPLAIRNVGFRCLASAQWILGIAPIVAGLVLILLRVGFPQDDTPFQTTILRGLTAAVICLHLVHIPYWFTGIMHWHYVFETAPLVLILVAAGLASVAPTVAHLTSRRAATTWLTCFIAASLMPGWISSEVTWGSSRVASATSELAWSRTHFELFNRLTAADNVMKPALVLVDESQSDPQLSYIINDPEYLSDVLVARLPSTDEEIRQLQEHFSDRTLYQFTPESFSLTPITPKQQ